MPTSNFPNGFPDGVSISNLPINLPISSKSNVFWVASSTMTGDGFAPRDSGKGTSTSPFATLDYAIGRCTANHGDVIFVAPGHTETVSAAADLVFDVAGITVFFMGEGTDQAKIEFTSNIAADMDIDAANITLINPRFDAGIDALTGPIDVNAVDFTIVNGTWHDKSGINTLDCIVATSGAARMRIFGWTFYKSNQTGTQKQSHIQLNGCDQVTLKDIDIRGNFQTGNIENVTDEVLDFTIENLKIHNENTDPQPGMVLDANAEGWAKNVDIRIESGTTYVSNVAKLNWDGRSLGYNADGGTGDHIGTAPSLSLEGKIDSLQADLGDPSARTNHQNIEDMLGNNDAANHSIDDLLRTGHDSTAITANRDGSIMERTEFLMDEVSGTAGIAVFPAGVQAANTVSMAEVLRFAQEAVRNGTGTALDTDKSLVDVLGSDGTTVTDSAVSVLGAIGANNANNAYDSTTVAANADGSVLERQEYAQDQIALVLADTDTISGITLPADPVANSLAAFIASGGTALGTELADSKSIVDCFGTDGTTVTDSAVTILGAIGANNANNAFDSSTVAANADGSTLERLEYIQANLIPDAVKGLAVSGACDAGMGASATTIVSAHLSGYGDDYFNTKYYMQVVKNDNSVGNAPETQVRQITDYVSATGTFTVTAFGANVEENDEIIVIHESLVSLGRDDADNTIATTNVAANADGSVLERQEYAQDQIALVLADTDTISGATLPAAPTADSLAAFIASGGTALGTNLADSKSIVDAIGSDGTTLGYGSGSPLGAIGTYVVITKQLISSNILQDGVGTVDVTGVSSGGDLILESVTFNTDGTGLAAGTNFQLEISGNSFGATGAVVAEAVASLGANVTIAAKDASVTPLSGAVVESGAKIVATSTVAACTGGGIIEMQLVLRRVTAGATIAAA